MISTSNSNWLDRLRSSRGFPTGEEPDLDRFISSSSSGSVPTSESATHSESTQSQSAIPTRLRSEKDAQWDPFPREFTGVLSDLFNMGEGTSRSFSMKSSRKQANPRFCRVSLDNELPSSSNDLRREKSENGGLVSSGDNSLNERRDNNNSNNGNIRVDELRIDDAEEGENVDLKGYSRNEVTIIDTSFKEWKSDKWVFRKNDEWKIKEKKSKCKSRVSGGKKRKLLVSSLGDNKLDDQLEKKKKKDDEISLQPNKGQTRNDKAREPLKEREGLLGKVPQKRFPCPRPPEKFINEGSPVILLKSIPPSNGNVAIKLNKTFYKKRPKQMKIV